jgi:hypothetical protein
MTAVRRTFPWLLLMLAGPLNADERRWTWDFDNDVPGEKPVGFYFDETGRAHEGKWRVVNDQGKHVLAQLDRSRDRDRYALAVVEESSIEDVRASIRLKIVEGDVDKAGGLVWRYRDSENYLVARLDVEERNIRLSRVRDGNRVQFGVKSNLNVEVGKWYTLRIEHRGREVKVYLDDEALIIERDRHFRRAGRVGLWTIADSAVHFDDFHAEELERRDDDRD